MKVLALGLPRTGSASIAEALTILGYRNVSHGLRFLSNSDAWGVLNRAADATFPNLSTYTGRPFSRAQWDEFYGASEAATDVAAAFKLAPELIIAYPNAKVLLVVRDFDPWHRSMELGVFQAVSGPLAWFYMRIIEPLAGSVTVVTAQAGPDMVPLDQLLICRLADG
ncbi:hypothetical protein AURDEDRAFT_156617 [Auricularia subglabra TFB-10046 SS5]|nr:hypothetical protein AURDEDRAFT_156617 [Auricularia subglabra TFB-10046 SS5]